MPKVLLLGGSHDGRRIEVTKCHETLRLQKILPFEKGLSRFLAPIDLRNIEEYRMQMLIDGDGSEVYVYAIPGTQIIQKLVQGYSEHGY